ARNTEAVVTLYADKITGSMAGAMQETERRRVLQQEYNKLHGITPYTVKREVVKSIANIQELIAQASKSKKNKKTVQQYNLSQDAVRARIVQLENQMREAAEKCDFERAIALRAEWKELQGRE